jgi:hypothetical protein
MGNNKIIPFNVNVKNNSAQKYKVDEVNANGKKLDKFITYEDLNGKNAILNFNMK